VSSIPTEAAPAAVPEDRRLSTREVWALGALLGLALVLRTVLLAAVPPGMKVEEAQLGLRAYAQQASGGDPIAPLIGEPRGGRVLIEGVATLIELLGTSVVSLRLAPALCGALSVAIVFLLARRLLGPAAAIGAGALLATSRWHLRFSREADPAVLVPLLALLGVVVCERYFERGSWPRAAGLAAWVGAALLAGPELMLPALAPLALWVAVRLLDGREPRRLRRGLLVGAAIAAVFIAAWLAKPETVGSLVGRGVRPKPEASSADALGNQLKSYWSQQPNLELGFAGAALLNPVQVGLLLIGAGLLLARARRAPGRAALLIGWLALSLLPLWYPMARGPDSAASTLGALVAVVLISGVALEAASRLAARAGRLAIGLVVAVPLVASAALDTRTYFAHWAEVPEVQAEYSGDMREFAAYLRALARDHEVYLSPFVYYAPNLRFLALGTELKLLAGPAALTFERPPRRDPVYVVDSPVLAQMVRGLYPGAREIRSFSVYGAARGRFLRVDRHRAVASFGSEQRAEMVRLQYRLVQELRTRYEPSIWQAMSRDPAFLKQNLLPPALLQYPSDRPGPAPVQVQ